MPELDDGELDEQKCTQKIGILPGPTKKWRIRRVLLYNGWRLLVTSYLKYLLIMGLLFWRDFVR